MGIGGDDTNANPTSSQMVAPVLAQELSPYTDVDSLIQAQEAACVYQKKYVDEKGSISNTGSSTQRAMA